MQTATIPIGPGKGRERPLDEALQSLIGEMGSHIRDLREMKQVDQADELEKYMTALEVIYWQIADGAIFGTGIPGDVTKRADKYHLARPSAPLWIPA